MNNTHNVMVLELNEITWDIMDPLLEKGLLPNFRNMMDTGVRGEPWASEEPQHLDPWVTWTTLYTGVPQEVHRLTMLEQDRETLGAKRLWEYLQEAGLRIGLFGSANSWPPKSVDGFWIPGPFSRDFATFPSTLGPIQALNVGLTQGHTAGIAKPKLSSLLPKLMQLGLSVPTLTRLATAIIDIRRQPTTKWKQIALQPVVNLDLFAALYRRYRPRFATFHSNHVAYYQHRFWRAMAPEAFEVPPSEEERRIYSGAIEHGYRVADELLGRLRKLCGPDTTLIVLSSCGQQPATGGRYTVDQRCGNIGLQTRIELLLQTLGIIDQVKYSNLMAPQWKIDIDAPALLEQTVTQLKLARNLDRQIPCFGVETEGRSICLTARRDQQMSDEIEIITSLGPRIFQARELFIKHSEVAKSGRHHPKGVLLMHGTAVRNVRIDRCDNLDIAPTLLRLLNQPIPPCMHGRVLEEAILGNQRIASVAH